MGEKAAIGGMTLIRQCDQSATGIPIHNYWFPTQDTDLRSGDKLKVPGQDIDLGEVIEIDQAKGEIKIKKTGKSRELHPTACFKFESINQNVLQQALFRMGEFVAENGIERDGAYASGRHYPSTHHPAQTFKPFSVM